MKKTQWVYMQYKRLIACTIVATMLILVACTVRLAPQYDESIEKDTVKLHRDVAEFFETIKAAPPNKRTYSIHKEFYIKTIADIRSIQLRALTRPQGMSPSKLFKGKSEDRIKSTEKALMNAENECYSPEDNELAKMLCLLLDSIISMREVHKSHREGTTTLTDAYVDEARPLIDAQFAAIIEAEKFLKR
jgi:hypothetical protein